MQPLISALSIERKVGLTVCIAVCIVLNALLAIVMPRIHRAIWAPFDFTPTFFTAYSYALRIFAGIMIIVLVPPFVLMWLFSSENDSAWVLWEGLVWNMATEVSLLASDYGQVG